MLRASASLQLALRVYESSQPMMIWGEYTPKRREEKREEEKKRRRNP